MGKLIVLLALLLTPQQQTFWSQNYPTGLVGWWKLSEGSGTVAYDSSGNGNNGAWSGTQTGSSGYYSAGHVGPWAGVFNGVATTGTIMKATVTGTISQFTLSEWVYLSAWNTAGTGIVVSTSLGGTSFYPDFSGVFGVTNGGTAFCSTAHTFGTTTATLWYQSWHLFTVAEDSTTVYVYVDGVLQTTNSRATSGGSVTNPVLQIGNTYSGRDLVGRINDVRLYNRALSAGEIAGLALAHN
jgi:hypothetical protein